MIVIVIPILIIQAQIKYHSFKPIFSSHEQLRNLPNFQIQKLLNIPIQGWVVYKI